MVGENYFKVKAKLRNQFYLCDKLARCLMPFLVYDLIASQISKLYELKVKKTETIITIGLFYNVSSTIVSGVEQTKSDAIVRPSESEIIDILKKSEGKLK